MRPKTPSTSMREGGVAQVVEQASQADLSHLLRREVQVLGHSPGHMHGSQGMLESGVIGPGIDRFHQAQLLYSL